MVTELLLSLLLQLVYYSLSIKITQKKGFKKVVFTTFWNKAKCTQKRSKTTHLIKLKFKRNF